MKNNTISARLRKGLLAFACVGLAASCAVDDPEPNAGGESSPLQSGVPITISANMVGSAATRAIETTASVQIAAQQWNGDSIPAVYYLTYQATTNVNQNKSKDKTVQETNTGVKTLPVVFNTGGVGFPYTGWWSYSTDANEWQKEVLLWKETYLSGSSSSSSSSSSNKSGYFLLDNIPYFSDKQSSVTLVTNNDLLVDLDESKENSPYNEQYTKNDWYKDNLKGAKNGNPFVLSLYEGDGMRNDLLWGKGYSAANAARLSIDLQHRMSLVRIKVIVKHPKDKDKGTEVVPEGSLLENTTVFITQLSKQALEFDRVKGEVSKVSDIDPYGYDFVELAENTDPSKAVDEDYLSRVGIQSEKPGAPEIEPETVYTAAADFTKPENWVAAEDESLSLKAPEGVMPFKGPNDPKQPESSDAIWAGVNRFYVEREAANVGDIGGEKVWAERFFLDEETEVYVSKAFVLPPQIPNWEQIKQTGPEAYPRLGVQIGETFYTGVIPQSMNVVRNGTATPMDFGYLPGYFLTLTVTLNAGDFNLTFLPVTVYDWVFKGNVQGSGYQSGASRNNFWELIETYNKYKAAVESTNPSEEDIAYWKKQLEMFGNWGSDNEKEWWTFYIIYNDTVLDLAEVAGSMLHSDKVGNYNWQLYGMTVYIKDGDKDFYAINADVTSGNWKDNSWDIAMLTKLTKTRCGVRTAADFAQLIEAYTNKTETGDYALDTFDFAKLFADDIKSQECPSLEGSRPADGYVFDIFASRDKNNNYVLELKSEDIKGKMKGTDYTFNFHGKTVKIDGEAVTVEELIRVLNEE